VNTSNHDNIILLPLSYDINYDIIVCTNCRIGIPFDWIKGHLKNNHGIQTTEAHILMHFDLSVPSIQSKDVVNWMETYSSIPFAIEGISVVKGFQCSLCLHCTEKRESMRVHIIRSHQETNITVLEANIQRPFGGWFKKYIQVEENNEMEQVIQEAWESELNSQFMSSLQTSYSGVDGDSMDIRLMNAFIAKVRYKLPDIRKTDHRWDLYFENIDLKKMAALAETPTTRDPLFPVISCARLYLRSVCSSLRTGNIIVRRKLMCAGFPLLCMFH